MIYADTNVCIRLIEGDLATRAPLESKLSAYRGKGRFLMTSRLTRLECRVKPLRENDRDLLKLYEEFFDSVEVGILDISAAVVEKATELRATLNVNTPDAIHLASAIIAGTSSFLTGDKALAKCADVRAEII